MHNRFLRIFHFIDDFNKDHIMSLDKKVVIIYRNYKEKYDENKILKIKNFCKSIKKKFFLANDIKLTIKLNLDGAYIPSFNKNISVSSLKNRNIILIGSAHNLREINEKKKQCMDLIVLSPVFKVSKTKHFLGVVHFNILAKQTKIPKIALGGINSKNIKRLNMLNCTGFASISYLKRSGNMVRNFTK
jgi:thiamine-phosphate pyrophosphorylase|tara:strand:+ start:810 stop:1373 length:564 start_codon:yes stop_codon:yes gene_type:complete